MHELAIAQSIAEVVSARAAERQATRVTSVRLRVGEASGVVTDSLTFCFEMLASLDPVLAPARLSVERTPHRAWCERCAGEFPVRDYIARCPECGEWSDQIVSGRELQVLEMEIET
ncbi:MAG TPA: hydrogenase maturation nickel metallochaperone HypA [Ktedonobacterales bacterium]